MYEFICKFNRLFALLILLLLIPFLIFISILIFFFIDKKIFFIQQRVGLNNKVFNCYKFSTMLNNNQFKGNLPSDEEVFRINKLGNFLRRYFFDELPQLVNIIKGDMNFIGPRPHSTFDHESFKKKIISYLKRHQIKPGMTGLAQVNGYNGAIKNNHQLFKRTSNDLLYIKEKNLLLDLQIVLKTFLLPFRKIKNNLYLSNA
jgi:putative colanic acid biosysnthesis UDP-glucose lipid carrier transferase